MRDTSLCESNIPSYEKAQTNTVTHCLVSLLLVYTLQRVRKALQDSLATQVLQDPRERLARPVHVV